MPTNRSFLGSGGKLAWGLIGGVLLLLFGSTVLLAKTANIRYERDITRMVFNHNEGLLADIKKQLGAAKDSLETQLAASPEVTREQPYLVISIAENKLWYKQGDQTLFETQVATGSGKVLVQEGSSQHFKFETPRGRLLVKEKEVDPVWMPPDWHYIEQGKKKGLGVVHLNRKDAIPLPDGSVIAVEGNDVVRKSPDGTSTPLTPSDGKEIVAGGNLVVPPFGTNQRKYKGVLGTRRLVLGDGYGIHGTDHPETIGRSVSHGCVRLRNEDIERLFEMVAVGTPVFIY
jgi:hypothetical protein